MVNHVIEEEENWAMLEYQKFIHHSKSKMRSQNKA